MKIQMYVYVTDMFHSEVPATESWMRPGNEATYLSYTHVKQAMSYLVDEVHIGSMLDRYLGNPHTSLGTCHHEGCVLY